MTKVRTGNAAENLSVVRHLVLNLNLLRQNETTKASIKCKCKRADWDNDGLLVVLSQ